MKAEQIKAELKSKLAPFIKQVIDDRAAAGYASLNAAEHLLAFDRFIAGSALDDGRLSKEAVSAYRDSLDPALSSAGKNVKLRALRLLSVHLFALGHDAFYPPRSMMAAEEKPCWFVPTPEQVKSFIQKLDAEVAAKKAAKLPGVLQLSISMIARVLYCCGLRVGETCRLKREDVDLDRLMIAVKNSKRHKLRYCFMDSCLGSLLRRYDEYIEQRVEKNRELFFVSVPHQKAAPARVLRTTVAAAFHRLCLQIEEFGPDFRITPHTLRHAYCVHRIDSWENAGLSLKALLPALQQQLGHSSLQDVFYYYHQLSASSQAIRRHLDSDSAVSKEFLHEMA